MGSIYGTKDAGRAWYMHLKKVLEHHAWEESSFERAVFVKRARGGDGCQPGEVVAVLFAHVDDLLLACHDQCRWLEGHLSDLQKLLHLERRDSNCFDYCGKQITVSTDAYRVGCPKAMKAVEPIPIPKGRADSALLVGEETTA